MNQLMGITRRMRYIGTKLLLTTIVTHQVIRREMPHNSSNIFTRKRRRSMLSMENLKGNLEDVQMIFLSRSGPREYKNRPREESDQRLVNDYFSKNPLYNDKDLCERFRMRKSLFQHIVGALGEWNPYFTARVDVVQREGLSPLQ